MSELPTSPALSTAEDPRASSKLRSAARIALGLALAGAGVTHLTLARDEFRAQVPDTLVNVLPVSADDIVLGSGIVELGLGLAFAGLSKERRRLGVVMAMFFVAVFPGNISQWAKHADGFGLDTDTKRLARLAFQPLLVLWALFAGEIL